MPKQKYSLNQHYFDEINTPNKAYILGFIFADGNISDGLDKHYRLRITLQIGDKELLDKIKDELEFGGEIKVRENKNKYLREKDKPLPLIAELSISNKHMITKLKEIGVVPAKSSIKQYPKLPNEFQRDFIRGYFDGNGSIYTRSEKHMRKPAPRIEIMSGSKDFFWVMWKIILNNVEGLTNKAVNELKTKIRVTKDRPQAMRILYWLYEGSELHLERKYKLYCYWKDN